MSLKAIRLSRSVRSLQKHRLARWSISGSPQSPRRSAGRHSHRISLVSLRFLHWRWSSLSPSQTRSAYRKHLRIDMAINSWSRNRKLVLTWSTFLFLFLTTAVILLVTASIWRGGDQQLGTRTLQRLVWTNQFSNGQSTNRKIRIRLLDLRILILTLSIASVVLGVVIIVTCAIGVVGFWQGHGKGNGDNSTGLIIFNFVLLATSQSTS